VSDHQQGDRVRMVVEPRGAVGAQRLPERHQFVLEVRPVKEDPNKLVQGPGYQGEKLSLNFQNIEVRALLQVIADFTNFNIVTSDTVTGNHAAAEGRALGPGARHHPAVQGPGHAQERQRAVDRAADELATKEKLELEARSQIAELEPLRTEASSSTTEGRGSCA
jgi:type IV pilus assembly protein PilQ